MGSTHPKPLPHLLHCSLYKICLKRTCKFRIHENKKFPFFTSVSWRRKQLVNRDYMNLYLVSLFYFYFLFLCSSFFFQEVPESSFCLFLELTNIRKHEIIAGESWFIVLVPDTSDSSSPRSCPEETSSTDCSEVHVCFWLCYLKAGGFMQVNTRLELHKNWLYTVNIVFPSSLSCVGGKPVWTCARPFHMLLFVTSISFQNFPVSFIFSAQCSWRPYSVW